MIVHKFSSPVFTGQFSVYAAMWESMSDCACLTARFTNGSSSSVSIKAVMSGVSFVMAGKDAAMYELLACASRRSVSVQNANVMLSYLLFFFGME